ncbi:MAG: hypothetical protein H6735_26160, partial [Alphaproteobacteria bacterium]|nr:hypothetical protein [Alphaproteobacteria bacterium]
MALRVRKLARELERSPEDVLLLLKDLGYERYRTPEDLLTDDVVARARKAARTTPPRARVAATARSAPPAPRSKPPIEADLMAQLVPGAVRTGARPVARTAPPLPAPPRGRGPVLAEERADEARGALAAERERLERARAELAAERAALADERDRLLAERDALRLERDTLERAVAERDRTVRERSVLGLLEARGLSGTDEAERAVAALAQHKELGRLLGGLTPIDPEGFRRLLADRLLLVAGPPPEGVGAAVQVAEDRADIATGPELHRRIARIGQGLLLEGCRRVLVAGLSPRLHGLLREHLDPRVELAFRPGGVRDEAGIRADLERGDLIVTWN